MDNLVIKMQTKTNIKARVSNSTSGGASIQTVLDAITVSNGLKDTRGVNKLDISGEELQTRALTNMEIEKILNS